MHEVNLRVKVNYEVNLCLEQPALKDDRRMGKRPAR